MPTTVPSLTSLDGLCRRGVFEAVYAVLVAFQSSEGRGLDSLTDSRDELQQSFDDADARGALKVMVEALAGPLIDDEIENARTELDLDRRDRLDLIGFLAKEDDDLTEGEIRTQLADARDLVGRIHGMGRVVALVLVIVGSIVMGLLYFRNTAGMVRWPGVTLLSAGLVCLIVGLVLESQAPGSLEGAVGLDAGLSSTATDWINDIIGGRRGTPVHRFHRVRRDLHRGWRGAFRSVLPAAAPQEVDARVRRGRWGLPGSR